MVKQRGWRELPADRIYLSKASVTEGDVEEVVAALRTGWLAPNGPALAAFEHEVSRLIGVREAVGLASGTAALHLALRRLGVGPGDFVLVPSLTFAATAFAVRYLGGTPVFVDSDSSWNIDPDLISVAAESLHHGSGKVRAAISVDLYGTPADYRRICETLDAHGIPLLEDSAEALGSRHDDGPAGSFGIAGALSFNGNKIMTTSGGGMLLTNDEDFADEVRYWATQAREPVPWYEHKDVGYNYRLSNILAALGRSQLTRIADEVERRRMVRSWYRDELAEVEGVTVQEDPTWGTSNAWLTVAQFARRAFPEGPTPIMALLESHEIESRPVWKPLHLQPVFSEYPAFLTGRAQRLFEDGLCLPSGSDVDREIVARICSLIRQSAIRNN